MGLRKVKLPAPVGGQLFLSALPGRFEPLARTQQNIAELGIDRVVCLVPLKEIEHKSPDYARAICSGSMLIPWEYFPIQDFGVSPAREAFLALARSLADRLENGEKILIHCSGGVGRSGTLAVSVLLASGLSLKEAQAIVREAGSQPETEAQQQLVHWVEQKIKQ